MTKGQAIALVRVQLCGYQWRDAVGLEKECASYGRVELAFLLNEMYGDVSVDDLQDEKFRHR